jgi:hypothetical protein
MNRELTILGLETIVVVIKSTYMHSIHPSIIYIIFTFHSVIYVPVQFVIHYHHPVFSELVLLNLGTCYIIKRNPDTK